MTHIDNAVSLARAEIVGRTFAVTRQYFATHEVLADASGSPVIARVDETTEVGAYQIYFPLREVPYHCVVVVRPTESQTLAVSWVYIQPATRVYLSIRSQSTSPDEITRRIGLEPTSSKIKGAASFGNRRFPSHQWDLDALLGLAGGFDEKLGALIRLVQPVAGAIAALQPECEAYLSIVFEGWGGDPQFGSLHLDAQTTRVLAAAGAAVDIQLYAFGPPMAEGD